PGERLVDAVVDDFVDEVVEPAGPCRADVHARSKPDRFESFEDRDVLGGVGCFTHRKSPGNRALPGTPNGTRTSGRNPAWQATLRRFLPRLCEGSRPRSARRAHGPDGGGRHWVRDGDARRRRTLLTRSPEVVRRRSETAVERESRAPH